MGPFTGPQENDVVIRRVCTPWVRGRLTVCKKRTYVQYILDIAVFIVTQRPYRAFVQGQADRLAQQQSHLRSYVDVGELSRDTVQYSMQEPDEDVAGLRVTPFGDDRTTL